MSQPERQVDERIAQRREKFGVQVAGGCLKQVQTRAYYYPGPANNKEQTPE